MQIQFQDRSSAFLPAVLQPLNSELQTLFTPTSVFLPKQHFTFAYFQLSHQQTSVFQMRNYAEPKKACWVPLHRYLVPPLWRDAHICGAPGTGINIPVPPSTPGQCFSSFPMHTNHLGILVKVRFWFRSQWCPRVHF